MSDLILQMLKGISGLRGWTTGRDEAVSQAVTHDSNLSNTGLPGEAILHSTVKLSLARGTDFLLHVGVPADSCNSAGSAPL